MDIQGASETAGGVSIGGGLLAWFIKWWLTSQQNFKRAVWKRFKEIEEEIDAHALYDAENYAKRGEISDLREHLDNKFDALNKTLIDVIRDGNKGGGTRR